MLNEDNFIISEEQESVKYSWYQIIDLCFTAQHYLESYLYSVLGPDDNRDIIWINKTSSHLYATRWHPDFCFIFIPDKDADMLDMSMRKAVPVKIGYLAMNNKKQLQKFSRDYIDSLVVSPFYEELLDTDVFIIHGPLEDFYGKVDSYSNDLNKYILKVQLLVSFVLYPHHITDFIPLKELQDGQENNIL